MEKIKEEFLDILAQVRTHLEYQKALGVSHVGVTAEEARSEAPAAPAVKPVTPTPARPVQEVRQKDVPVQPVRPAPLSTPAREQAETTGSRTAQPGPQGLEGVRSDLKACAGCKLGKSRKAVVFSEGSSRADVLFVGGVPGAEDEKQGKPFADDKAGQLLTDIIVKGMKLRREDLYIATAVKCRTPEGRAPEPDEVEACAGYLAREIDAVKPKVIVALGGAAADALLKKGRDIAALRGTWHDFYGIPVMPTFEPAQLLANPGDKKAVWEDIQKVLARLKK